MVKFALYEQKDGRLRKLHQGCHDSPRIFKDFLGQPESGQNPCLLLVGMEEELMSLMTLEEAKRKKLLFGQP